MRVALCQLNSTVGDMAGNAARMLAWYRAAALRGASLVVFPELSLTGYPPRDLLDLDDFLRAVGESVFSLAGASGPAGLLFGAPLPNPRSTGKRIMNAAVFCAEGRVLAEVGKKLLPIYDVFDEARHFEPDPEPACPVEFAGLRWGVHVCEDAWNEDGFWPRRLYTRDPVQELAAAGSQVLVNISASPFHARKIPVRRAIFESHCRRLGLPLLYTNAVGGNDELVFDGEAYVYDGAGRLLASGLPFEEGMLFVEVEPAAPGDAGPAAAGAGSGGAPPARVRPLFGWNPDRDREPEDAEPRPELEAIDSIHRALILGLRDYAAKCGFRSAVLGLSGGIDSALTAALAAEALGPEHVWGISLPGRYSSPGSLADAETLVRNLGIRHHTLSIEPMFTASLDTLASAVPGGTAGVTEENLQARIRGLLLMALSNRYGHLLLSTGNKSELAVGYCTLYGDMAGGLALISDLPKTTVYALSRHLNRARPVIPESTLTKPPSAELKPDQADQDTLPPYEILDAILERYVEEGRRVPELIRSGFPEDVVLRIVRLVSGAEYKRRQAAPGIKISPKAFGSGRRMPIATAWPP